MGEGVAREVHPAAHGEAAAHADQEDVKDGDGDVCLLFSSLHSSAITILERRMRSDDDGDHNDDAP